MSQDAELDRWGSKYKDEMCEELIEMFSEGKTQAQFCAKHSIATDTFQKWRKSHKAFDRACLLAHNKARDYYDNMRHENLLDPTVNWNTFNKMYSCRFNIADKRTVRVDGFGTAKDERAMLKCLNRALANEELTPDEAQKLTSLVDMSLKVKQTCELEDRLITLEKANK